MSTRRKLLAPVAALLILAGCRTLQAPTAPDPAAAPVTQPGAAPTPAAPAPERGAIEAAARTAVRDYFAALARQDLPAAYGLLSANAQKLLHGPGDLAGNRIKAVRSIDFPDIRITAGSQPQVYLTVTLDLEELPGASAWSAGKNTRYIHLVQEGGGWKLDAIATRAFADSAHTASPAEVVRQYYALAAQGDWQAAWGLLHPAAQSDPLLHRSAEIRARFLAQKGGPQLVEASDGPMLDEYKIYSTQTRVANVATVNARFADGTQKLIHLAQDGSGQWRLFWLSGPDPGLE